MASRRGRGAGTRTTRNPSKEGHDEKKTQQERLSDIRVPVNTEKYSRYSPRGAKSPSRHRPQIKHSPATEAHGPTSKSTALVKSTNVSKSMASSKGKTSSMLVPTGYTVRPIIPAEKAELIPVARAMAREEFAPRVKKLFDPEREAAIEAIKSGIYIGWRFPDFKHDCIRVGIHSKCFCGHTLSEHGNFNGRSYMVPCKAGNCPCKGFAFIPSRPEEVGEFWLQKRPGFDPSTWRAKCKCKHTHEEHSPVGMRKCRRGCGCSTFFSNFLCAACDKHWEQHETVFESEAMRKDAGIPYGEAYLPFHELPELRNIVLTGRDDDESEYLALTSGRYAIPSDSPTDLALQLRGGANRDQRR